MFFHIDEDAYQKLSRYFDAIKRSLSNSAGQDEIIKDIEMRIAELVSEKHTSDKQVISLKELDEIITVMGQPEDYRIENDEQEQQAFNYTNERGIKKLYRDTEKGMLGGVCAGLGHYFGIDAVWLRIIFVVLLLGYGIGLLPYIVLWIVMPSAKTTAEKLEMTGEPVNISNIERKVREEYETLSERFKSANLDAKGKQVKTGFERAAGGVGKAFSGIFRVFAKLLGALIVVFSASALIGMLVALFTLGSTSLVDVPWQPYIDSVNYTSIPLWLVGVLFFLAIGIPFFFLFILGLKLLSSSVKSIGNIAKYSLIAIWAISVAALIVFGVKQATEVAFDNKEVVKQNIELSPGDTLKVKFRFNDYFAKDVYRRHDYIFTQDESNNEVIYSNNVSFEVIYTDEKTPYLQIEKQARGRSIAEARERAKDIRYGFEIRGNEIILDNYLITNKESKYRDQEVEIFLYLPKGTLFKPDSSVREFDSSDDWVFNLHHSGSYLYRVNDGKLLCIDCPPEENDYEDVEQEPDTVVTTVISVNGKIVTDEVINTPAKGLEVSADGTIVRKQ